MTQAFLFGYGAILLVFSDATIALSLYSVLGTLREALHVALRGIDLQAPMVANSQRAERA